MSVGAWVLVASVLLALALGLWRAYADGRFRGTHPLRTAVPPAVEARGAGRMDTSLPTDIQLGERATLLQFSSAFCAPCRATRRTLGELAAVVPGVTHVELDAEHHLGLVRQLGILRTPTTLVLDAAGHEVRRATGAPRKEQVLAALEEACP